MNKYVSKLHCIRAKYGFGNFSSLSNVCQNMLITSPRIFKYGSTE